MLFKCVQWLCLESIPLVKFKSLLELLHDLGLEDIAILKRTNISYHSYTTSDDILQCLSDVIVDELKEKLEKSLILTALADESTDKTRRVCFQIFLLYLYLDPIFFCDAKIGDNSVVREFDAFSTRPK